MSMWFADAVEEAAIADTMTRLPLIHHRHRSSSSIIIISSSSSSSSSKQQQQQQQQQAAAAAEAAVPHRSSPSAFAQKTQTALPEISSNLLFSSSPFHQRHTTVQTPSSSTGSPSDTSESTDYA
jgi:hypothetical protein